MGIPRWEVAMFVVLSENYDYETHSVWGPFDTFLRAETWARKNEEKLFPEGFIIEVVADPL
jgi:hypothetical protein